MFKNIFVGVLVILFSSNLVLAADMVDLPEPGLTPDSPWYFLDTWRQKRPFIILRKN